jgi:hypothetical protein
MSINPIEDKKDEQIRQTEFVKKETEPVKENSNPLDMFKNLFKSKSEDENSASKKESWFSMIKSKFGNKPAAASAAGGGKKRKTKKAKKSKQRKTKRSRK